MKKILSVTLMYLFMYSTALSQDSLRHVNWTTNNTWNKVLQTAKKENKYIFVDCFATWCKPCKYMDKYIFTDRQVTDLLDRDFISVKLQIDSTKNDNNETKKWYETAARFSKTYSINVLPTYLFFSPSGELVHKAVGSQKATSFTIILTNAKDENRQIFTLLKKYESGMLEIEKLRFLAESLKVAGNIELANQTAKEYIKKRLLTLGDKELFKKDNLEFILNYTASVNDESFNLLYLNEYKIDSLFNQRHYTEAKIDYIIATSVVDPELKICVEKKFVPRWNEMYQTILKSFGPNYAHRAILGAKERYYGYMDEKLEVFKAYVVRYKTFGLSKYETKDERDDSRGVTNNMAWDIFLFCNDSTIIKVALEWMEKLVNIYKVAKIEDAGVIDTYANLLYKTNQVNEAIEWETIAVKMEVTKGTDKNSIKGFTQTLDKMKKGVKTWVSPDM